VPEHRGKGAYRAVVATRLAHCRAKGIDLAVGQARETTSASILERRGFQTVYRFRMLAASGETGRG